MSDSTPRLPPSPQALPVAFLLCSNEKTIRTQFVAHNQTLSRSSSSFALFQKSLLAVKHSKERDRQREALAHTHTHIHSSTALEIWYFTSKAVAFLFFALCLFQIVFILSHKLQFDFFNTRSFSQSTSGAFNTKKQRKFAARKTPQIINLTFDLCRLIVF
jgi:hypothetical protein